jgi:hypothetical protein
MRIKNIYNETVARLVRGNKREGRKEGRKAEINK